MRVYGVAERAYIIFSNYGAASANCKICKIIEIMRYLKSERSLNSQHRTKNIIQI